MARVVYGGSSSIVPQLNLSTTAGGGGGGGRGAMEQLSFPFQQSKPSSIGFADRVASTSPQVTQQPFSNFVVAAAAPAASNAVAGGTDSDANNNAGLYEVLVDEVRHVEGERDAAIARERLLMSALESLAAYTATLEQNVLLPAMGELNVALARYHDVAAARAGGIAAIGAVEGAGVVNPQTNPLAAKAFASLRRPSAQTMQTAQRNALLSQPLRGGPGAAEDALTMAAGMLNATEQLQSLLTDAFRAVEDYGAMPSPQAATVQSGVSQSRTSAQTPAPISTNGGEIGTLRRELELTIQNYESKLHAAAQERALLDLKSESMQHTVSRLENENRTLQLKLEALSVKDNLFEQAAREKAVLQQRVEELEAAVARNAQDKLEVAHRFETLQRYIQQQAASQQQSGGGVVAGTGSSNSAAAAAVRHQLEEALNENSMLRQQLRELQVGSGEELALLRQQVVSLQLKQQQQGIGGGGSASADDFTRELQRLRNARSGSPLDAAPGEETAAAYKAKLKVFEMTVAALNAELSALEEKLVVIERNAVEDRRRLVNEMDSERQQHREEQAECDAVVQRITAELEGLMKENAQLKARLREYHRQLTSGDLA